MTEDEERKKLVNSLLDAQLEAQPTPGKYVRFVQGVMAIGCVAGAFLIAILLVTTGPPEPKTAAATQYSDTVPQATGPAAEDTNTGRVPDAAVAVYAVTDGEGATGADGTTNEEDGTGEEGATGEDGVAGEPVSESECESSDSAECETSTSILSEEAPWAFAIVALLVGAFLITGKTINLGKGTNSSSGA